MKKYIIEEINNVSQIPDYKFSGYYWMSNAEKPKMLFEEKFPINSILEKNNPFCIEALLYSSNEGITIHIQHTGQFQVIAFDHKRIDKLETINKEYIPHKLEHVKKVLFKQIWEEEELKVDEATTFLTLKPTALIFSGFNY